MRSPSRSDFIRASSFTETAEIIENQRNHDALELTMTLVYLIVKPHTLKLKKPGISMLAYLIV